MIRLFVLKGYEHLESKNLLGKDGCRTAKHTNDLQHLLSFKVSPKLRTKKDLETGNSTTLPFGFTWVHFGFAEKKWFDAQGGKGKGAPSPVMESRLLNESQLQVQR